MENKTQAIQKAKRLSKLTGEGYSVFKTLSGYEVIPDSVIHTAMGVCIYEC